MSGSLKSRAVGSGEFKGICSTEFYLSEPIRNFIDSIVEAKSVSLGRRFGWYLEFDRQILIRKWQGESSKDSFGLIQ